MSLTNRNTENDESILPEWIDSSWLKSFRSKLLAWYRTQGRDLPWRETTDPYCVLVSEIMLQQTQAITVIPYYFRFLERFPTASELAQADEAEVLSYWEGLGYYRRAKSLHRAAKSIMDDFNGTFPSDFQQILELPGIGRYTAGAVASFALGQRKPIVEANTQRLYSRLLLYKHDLVTQSAQRQLWNFATAILPKKEPGILNHAVMDLGAMVCKPKNPCCLICPVRNLCPTFEHGLQATIPFPKRRKKTVERFEIAVSIQDNQGRILVWQRPDGGWWAGMWDLPRTLISGDADSSFEEFQAWFLNQFGVNCKLGTFQKAFHHHVTHHHIVCKLFTASIIHSDSSKQAEPQKRKGRSKMDAVAGCLSKKSSAGAGRWVTAEEAGELPFSSSGRKMMKWILKN